MSKDQLILTGLTEQQKSRFWARVRKTGPGECWLWLDRHGRARADEYGRVTFGRRWYAMHRVAWLLTNGAIPEGLFACHRCDVRGCCNPSHLFLGDQADNMIDCANKGRTARGASHGLKLDPERAARGDRHGTKTHPDCSPKGSRNGQARLTEADVLAIREACAAGQTRSSVARRFHVSTATVILIAQRKTWRHI